MIVVPNHPPPQDGNGASQWRHNERDDVSNHRHLHCLLNCWSKRRCKIYQSSASLVFVRGIHRWPLNSPRKRPVTRKMFPFVDVIMGNGDFRKGPFLSCYEFWHASRYWILVTSDPDSARWRHIDRGAGGVNDRRVIPISDSFQPWWRHQMETFSALLAIKAPRHWPLCGEFTRTKASDAELWCFLWSAPE